MKEKHFIKDVFHEYARHEVVMAGLALGTLYGYDTTKTLVMGFFGDIHIEGLDAEAIADFYEHISSWQSPDTASNHICRIRQVLKYCRRKNMRVMDFQDIKVPKREKRVITYLTDPEAEEFIVVVGRSCRGYSLQNRQRNVAIVELLFATGIRVGELCKLNRNSIRDRKFTVAGKSKHPRICFITPRVEEILAGYLASRDDGDPALFVSNQTKKRISICTVQRVFRFACAHSNFTDVTPHTMRHSFATKMLEKGVDLRYVGDLLGHQSLDTTKHYTHYANPRLKAIYDAAHA